MRVRTSVGSTMWYKFHHLFHLASFQWKKIQSSGSGCLCLEGGSCHIISHPPCTMTQKRLYISNMSIFTSLLYIHNVHGFCCQLSLCCQPHPSFNLAYSLQKFRPQASLPEFEASIIRTGCSCLDVGKPPSSSMPILHL